MPSPNNFTRLLNRIKIRNETKSYLFEKIFDIVIDIWNSATNCSTSEGRMQISRGTDVVFIYDGFRRCDVTRKWVSKIWRHYGLKKIVVILKQTLRVILKKKIHFFRKYFIGGGIEDG